MHQFNSRLASMYGIEEAILIHNFYYWIKKNAANDHNFRDGRYWTYNTTKAFQELFPYINETKIHRVIKHLVEADILLKEKYNSENFDRTCWYSFTDFACSLLNELGYDNTDFVKMKNGCSQNEMTIPNNKQTNNIKEKEDKSSFKKDADAFVDRMYSLYPTKCPMRNKTLGKSHKHKEKIKSLLKTYSMEEIEKVFRHEVETKLGIAWLRDFGTFLNNFPDPSQIELSPADNDTEADKTFFNGVEYR